MTLIDKAVWVAETLNSGEYPSCGRRLDKSLPTLDPNECALRALARLERGPVPRVSRIRRYARLELVED
ncbi:MAG: hypothetical protein HY078_16865 [Elusimicrobia bacterium]|nr:hypothetical protein [Elusimicrobiota bacterium]